MKSVFNEYHHLWPAKRLEFLEPILSKVFVLHSPREQNLIESMTVSPKDAVIINDNASLVDVVRLLEAGFEHCVQQNREDFAQELLTSGFMTQRPDIFNRDPITFFFNGFQSLEDATYGGRHIKFPFRSSGEKALLLERLDTFLDNSAPMSSIKDLCLQAADEMISNAIFHAPIKASGARVNDKFERSEDIWLPDGKEATLFACFSDQRVIIGCDDPFGSLSRGTLLMQLRSVFKDSATAVRPSGPSAGIGFKYLVDNCANFYAMCTKGKRTLIATAFLLKGLKANLDAPKHFHLSFR
jgi:hypothetical protein